VTNILVFSNDIPPSYVALPIWSMGGDCQRIDANTRHHSMSILRCDQVMMEALYRMGMTPKYGA
jgi:hypothetical protein